MDKISDKKNFKVSEPKILNWIELNINYDHLLIPQPYII